MNHNTAEKYPIVDQLQDATLLASKLTASGLRVREIRVHGRARPAIVLHRSPANKVPQLSGNIYAWGVDPAGNHYERRACTVDGIQIQWESPRQKASNETKPRFKAGHNIIAFKARGGANF